jgi:hypothetical protein
MMLDGLLTNRKLARSLDKFGLARDETRAEIAKFVQSDH